MTKTGRTDSNRNSRGFSILELLIAVAILLVIAVVAIPNMLSVVANSRLRAGMTSMSGLFQNCRMAAVKQNKMLSTHFDTPSSALVAYVKDATIVSPTIAVTDPQIKWAAPVILVRTPSGPGTPSTLLDSTILGFTPQTGDPSFNTRGLPCVFSGGNCTNSGFVYYFKDTSQPGTRGWAAVTISPAGRIKRWGWSGTSWID